MGIDDRRTQEVNNLGSNSPFEDHEDSGIDTYRVLDQPHSTRIPWRIICVGAGAAGLYVAYQCQKRMKDYDLVIYEKNPEIGGTWYENRYPGCACDIPSHIYTYSFRPNPTYSKYYAGSEEICEYFKKFEEEFGLRKFIQCDTTVIKAEWKDHDGIYEVQVRAADGSIRTDWCNTLINCSGILNEFKWPDIPGLRSFKGSMCHSARWDNGIDYAGKRVAVVGIGSSGIQITPKIQKIASSLEVFGRSPTWITPQLGGLGSAADSPTPNIPFITELLVRGQQPFDYTEEEKQVFQNDPELLLTFRRCLELAICNALDYCKLGSPKQNALFKICKESMENILGDNEELKASIIPKYALGCRRPTPGAGFLEALISDNTKAVFTPIKQITEAGIMTVDDKLHEFDAIIMATGFDIGFCPFYEVRGKGGVKLTDSWDPEPNSYLGIAAPGFPNFFSPLGPRGPWANGSVVCAMERNVENFVTLMIKMQAEGIKCIQPSQRATDDFATHAEEWHKDTVWSDPCHSWYKRGGENGKPYIWCGSIPAYMKTMSQVRFEDWEYEYRYQNRFAYLGNGKTQSEYLPEPEKLERLVSYVRNGENPWHIE